MRLLLDTCTFLWLIGQPGRLSPAVVETIADSDNACYLSAVSLWEILAKLGTGRLEIDSRDATPEAFLLTQRAAHRIEPLPLAEADVAQLLKLPALHRDPFDRMLICQAIEHGLTLVTPDPQVRRYPVKTLW